MTCPLCLRNHAYCRPVDSKSVCKKALQKKLAGSGGFARMLQATCLLQSLLDCFLPTYRAPHLRGLGSTAEASQAGSGLHSPPLWGTELLRWLPPAPSRHDSVCLAARCVCAKGKMLLSSSTHVFNPLLHDGSDWLAQSRGTALLKGRFVCLYATRTALSRRRVAHTSEKCIAVHVCQTRSANMQTQHWVG